MQCFDLSNELIRAQTGDSSSSTIIWGLLSFLFSYNSVFHVSLLLFQLQHPLHRTLSNTWKPIEEHSLWARSVATKSHFDLSKTLLPVIVKWPLSEKCHMSEWPILILVNAIASHALLLAQCQGSAFELVMSHHRPFSFEELNFQSLCMQHCISHGFTFNPFCWRMLCGQDISTCQLQQSLSDAFARASNFPRFFAFSTASSHMSWCWVPCFQHLFVEATSEFSSMWCGRPWLWSPQRNDSHFSDHLKAKTQWSPQCCLPSLGKWAQWQHAKSSWASMPHAEQWAASKPLLVKKWHSNHWDSKVVFFLLFFPVALALQRASDAKSFGRHQGGVFETLERGKVAILSRFCPSMLSWLDDPGSFDHAWRGGDNKCTLLEHGNWISCSFWAHWWHQTSTIF